MITKSCEFPLIKIQATPVIYEAVPHKTGIVSSNMSAKEKVLEHQSST